MKTEAELLREICLLCDDVTLKVGNIRQLADAAISVKLARDRQCADCGKEFVETIDPRPIRPSCPSCGVGA